MNKNNSNSFAIDVMLACILAALKLDGVIACKWIWVVSPIWGCFLVEFIIIAIFWIIAAMKSKPYKPMVYGQRTMWDAKTGRIYGDFDESEE